MKAAIVYNPIAGQRDRSDEIALLAGALQERGWTVAGVWPTENVGDSTAYARRAVEEGCDVVFAAGGDGTIARVAEGVAGTETALAILPGGTGNVMARQLNLPVPDLLHPRPMLDALPLLLAGQVRAVDLGRTTVAGGVSRHFLCWSGVGFDAQVTKTVDAEPQRKRRLGILAFIAAGLVTLRDFAGTRAVVRIDGRRVRQRLIMLVANNIQLYGAFLVMAPRALLDDNRLDIYAFHGRHPLRTFAGALRLLYDRRQKLPEVRTYQARRVEIVTARPLPVHVDGDTIGRTPAVIEVLPAALRLMVPASAPASLFVEGAASAPPESVVDWVSRLARDAQTALSGRSIGE